ncbi:alanine dehydrogenase [Enterococcus hulanensis]|uniref:alanine dehydrogenase n=1 Tax=Enterococcus hulanensis TaxID=2559929 RepID=UPI001A8C3FDC|nr:alanine dehydrogenase [Enterococcus hulanensis]MBO0459410.1 alanine dehydrogenase [Enterococcus hulanensis]
MIIGIPKEIKNNENRVALPPSGVFDLTNRGHKVLVETKAGLGSSITDEEYEEAGATIVLDPMSAWAAEMVVKVKEPLPEEYCYFRKGLLLFTYLHLAANKSLTEALLKAGVNSIAYENVQPADNSLPLLAPMSEIAGRMAAQIGANFLERVNGGRGVLLSGVPGVARGNVVVIGGGVVGMNAAKIAAGLGANVTIMDVSVSRLKQLDLIFEGNVQTLMSNSYNIQEVLRSADLVIGAVLIPGHKAPTLVSKEMVAGMPFHSVIVDVAIDQGGIFETTDKVTTHDNPTYLKEDVVHYAVANMPGAVPQTATYALSNSIMEYTNLLANNDLVSLLENNFALRRGLNSYEGKLTIEAVANDLDLPYTSVDTVLEG